MQFSISDTISRILKSRQDQKKRSSQGEVGRFWRAGGSDLLYELAITSKDLIIDAGGFEGEWTLAILWKYGCKVIVYEPSPDSYQICEEKFKNNDRVSVREAALSRCNGSLNFHIDKDSSSFFNHDSNRQSIRVCAVDVAIVVDQIDVDEIGCLKLNIEGGEYDVLERLIQTQRIKTVRNILVQFHKFPCGYEPRYQKLILELSKTHTLAWDYEMVWALWVKNN